PKCRRGRDHALARPVEGDPCRGAGSMNTERLLDGFNLLGDGPETVQQLRKLIVALAVAGKLTSTSETTTDPVTLMKLIEDRKRALIQKGELRKQDPVAKVTADDLPKGFSSPENYVRLGYIARI